MFRSVGHNAWAWWFFTRHKCQDRAMGDSGLYEPQGQWGSNKYYVKKWRHVAMIAMQIHVTFGTALFPTILLAVRLRSLFVSPIYATSTSVIFSVLISYFTANLWHEKTCGTCFTYLSWASKLHLLLIPAEAPSQSLRLNCTGCSTLSEVCGILRHLRCFQMFSVSGLLPSQFLSHFTGHILSYHYIILLGVWSIFLFSHILGIIIPID